MLNEKSTKEEIAKYLLTTFFIYKQAKESEKEFDEFLNEEVFPDLGYESIINDYYFSLKYLFDKKYIAGNFRLKYESDYEFIDDELQEVAKKDSLDFVECEVNDVKLTLKSQALVLTQLGKDLLTDLINNDNINEIANGTYELLKILLPQIITALTTAEIIAIIKELGILIL